MSPAKRSAGVSRVCLSNAIFTAALLLSSGILPGGTRPAFAQDAAPIAARLTLPQVVENLTQHNAERAAALVGYTSQRTYALDYKGIPSNMHAEMVVEFKYTAPATQEYKVISQSGSKWMIDLVLKRLLESESESHNDKNRDAVQITGRNYNFTMLASQDVVDGCTYVLGVEPKVPTKFLFRGRVWVDEKDFAVCRIEAEPAKNPSFWIKKTEIHHSFTKVGDFWLPAQNTSISHIRFDGRATLTIKYGDYEVRTTHDAAHETTHALNLQAPPPASPGPDRLSFH